MPKVSYTSRCEASQQRHQFFKRSPGTFNVGIAFLFLRKVASSDCETVYLGQGVFSSSSGLFTALYLPAARWHLNCFALHHLKRAYYSSERLVTLNVGHFVQDSHSVASEMCCVVTLFLDER